MILKPAQRAGDAPHTASEQGTSAELPRPRTAQTPPPQTAPSGATPPQAATTEPDRATRLPAPAREARLRAEREQWLRRRGLERQLHDGAALRISALALQLGLFQHRALESGPDRSESIEVLQDELHAVLQELRDVARRIYPPLLDVAGLGPALREAATRVDSPVRIEAPDDRFGAAEEGAAYFAVSAVLDSLAAGAPPLQVLVRREDAGLAVEVVGVAGRDVRAAAEMMLVQLGHLGGTIEVAGGTDAGTITARIPCE
jgi:signal transduction histidine kinase